MQQEVNGPRGKGRARDEHEEQFVRVCADIDATITEPFWKKFLSKSLNACKCHPKGQDDDGFRRKLNALTQKIEAVRKLRIDYPELVQEWRSCLDRFTSLGQPQKTETLRSQIKTSLETSIFCCPIERYSLETLLSDINDKIQLLQSKAFGESRKRTPRQIAQEELEKEEEQRQVQEARLHIQAETKALGRLSHGDRELVKARQKDSQIPFQEDQLELRSFQPQQVQGEPWMVYTGELREYVNFAHKLIGSEHVSDSFRQALSDATKTVYEGQLGQQHDMQLLYRHLVFFFDLPARRNELLEIQKTFNKDFENALDALESIEVPQKRRRN